MQESTRTARSDTTPPLETNSNRQVDQPGRGSKPATPFEQPLRSCGEVLQTFVPAVQEATYVIQRALGHDPDGFRAERMIKLAGKIYAEFRVALKMLELAQAKLLHESRRTTPRKRRNKITTGSIDHAERQSHEPRQPTPAAPETASHPDRRETADLAGPATDGAPQTAPPVACGDAAVCAGD